MPYEVTITAHAKRRFKKLPRPIQEHLVREAEQLKQRPTPGLRLRGALKGLYSLHTVYRRTDYRIVYGLKEQDREAVVVGVGKREDVYRRATQYWTTARRYQ
jgi:mRNA-degrading endonuclease RelE of RelBE toxin-antitoxin system